ncbi:unnamed protein product [Trichogramma brassicae]|uniref:C2H2-type domain-containing protein n=1 Tax=Trichogramma brassicae TaxID=86971 RepID=A0A6H5IBJ2_9HYME|nr:unnamed protein product [Trichogramma brassicae]
MSVLRYVVLADNISYIDVHTVHLDYEKVPLHAYTHTHTHTHGRKVAPDRYRMLLYIHSCCSGDKIRTNCCCCCGCCGTRHSNSRVAIAQHTQRHDCSSSSSSSRSRSRSRSMATDDELTVFHPVLGAFKCRKDFLYDKCEQKFGYKQYLLEHQKTVHEGRKDFVCDKCEKKFGRKADLFVHQKTVHEGRKDFACDRCEKKFGQKSKLIRHQRAVHEGQKDYACDKLLAARRRRDNWCSTTSVLYYIIRPVNNRAPLKGASFAQSGSINRVPHVYSWKWKIRGIFNGRNAFIADRLSTYTRTRTQTHTCALESNRLIGTVMPKHSFSRVAIEKKARGLRAFSRELTYAARAISYSHYVYVYRYIYIGYMRYVHVEMQKEIRARARKREEKVVEKKEQTPWERDDSRESASPRRYIHTRYRIVACTGSKTPCWADSEVMHSTRNVNNRTSTASYDTRGALYIHATDGIGETDDRRERRWTSDRCCFCCYVYVYMLLSKPRFVCVCVCIQHVHRTTLGRRSGENLIIEAYKRQMSVKLSRERRSTSPPDDDDYDYDDYDEYIYIPESWSYNTILTK